MSHYKPGDLVVIPSSNENNLGGYNIFPYLVYVSSSIYDDRDKFTATPFIGDFDIKANLDSIKAKRGRFWYYYNNTKLASLKDICDVAKYSINLDPYIKTILTSRIKGML